MQAQLILAIYDAIHEARVFGPVCFGDALKWIPDEHHTHSHGPEFSSRVWRLKRR